MNHGLGLTLTGALFGLVLLFGCGLSPRSREASLHRPADAENSKSAASVPADESEAAEIAGASSSPVVQTIFQKTKRRLTRRKIDELLLFQPSKYPSGNWLPTGLDFENVEFRSSDGTELHAWFCPCENARANVLFLHGNAGNLSGRAKFLKILQNGLRVSVLIPDYRGYGRSQGKATIDGAINDVRAASRELASRTNVKESDLIIWGRSLGGALAVQLAAQTQPRGLIVQSSFSSLKEVAGEHLPKLAWIVRKNRLNSVDTIGQFQGPLLQSHGTRDNVISFASGTKLHESANEPKQFLKLDGLGHNDPTPPSFYQEADRFIGRVSGTPPVSR